jgi:DNA replication and repair protein RecF
MIIKRIHIENFRNHFSSVLLPNKLINIIYGANGSGKTSILEAITIATIIKPFTNVVDSSLVNVNYQNYGIKIDFINHLNLDYSAEIKYDKFSKKVIKNSYEDNPRAKDIIGIVPVVFLSPDLKSITSGTPENRRDFIDRILSQSSKLYVEDLINFKKVIKQRNSILTNYKRNGIFDKDTFQVYTDLFIELSVKIIQRRSKFIMEFDPIFQKYYANITNHKENVSLEYLMNNKNELNDFDKNEIKNYMENKAKNLYVAELARGTTLFGPQKDEILIQLNQGNAREWASQGQHKSLLISLKLAEFDYLLNFTNETPIILLDDIFSELDDNRSQLVLDTIIEKQAQTFVTLTNPNLWKRDINIIKETKFFKVQNGEVTDGRND